MTLPEIVLYSKPACCLCDKVKEQLTRLQEKHSFTLREVNILENSSVYKIFKEEIPVVFVNGKKAFKYRLDEKEFIKLLHAHDSEQVKGTAPTQPFGS